MRLLFVFLIVLAALTSQAQHTLEKIWESDTTLAVPESVLFSQDGLYVSLIDGAPWAVDGKGEIAKLDKNGKIVNAAWVTGLNAPKGMGIWNKKLYVADVSVIAVIDLATGKIESSIPVEGANGLNDITIDSKGTIYVSDSQQGKVHLVKNGKVELYLSDLKGVNGLRWVGKELYILTGEGVFKSGADKKPVLISKMEIGGDGIEPVGKYEFVISCWPGIIYYLDKGGKMQTLLDTREQKKNTADIGYDPAQRVVYVPTFFKKSVVAYKLK